MRVLSFLAVVVLAAPVSAGAQTPRYTPEFLGSFLPGRVNIHSEVVGQATVGPNLRALVGRAGEPHVLLPLPAGMNSSQAYDISDNGVVVGRVGAYYSPEFSGRSAAWFPDGLGGYSVELLGALPGQTISSATAVNDRGDIIGYSSNGMFRYPVYYRAPGDVVDLTSTGIFDPVDINEERVMVDQSFTARRLDLDTMLAEDLGAPPPGPGGMHYVATRTTAINESGQVAGQAILATSTDCDRQVARYTDGTGWEIFSICGPYNGASDINDRGDMVMRIGITPYVRLEGRGTFAAESLIVSDVGHWYAVTGTAGWINNARQLVIYATNPATGQTGALLLTPEGAAGIQEPSSGAGATTFHGLSANPNPFQQGTVIRYRLGAAAAVSLSIHDARGRLVRRLLVDSRHEAGLLAVAWDGLDEFGRQVASGVYYCLLETESGMRDGRLVIAR